MPGVARTVVDDPMPVRWVLFSHGAVYVPDGAREVVEIAGGVSLHVYRPRTSVLAENA